MTPHWRHPDEERLAEFVIVVGAIAALLAMLLGWLR